MFILSEPILIVVYGERWLGAQEAMRVFIIYGFSKAITSVSSMTLLAVGRPWRVTISAGRVVCDPVYSSSTDAEIEGTASAVVISDILSHLVATMMAAIYVRQSVS